MLPGDGLKVCLKISLSRAGPLMTEETLQTIDESCCTALLELQERKLADVSVWDVLSARPVGDTGDAGRR